MILAPHSGASDQEKSLALPSWEAGHRASTAGRVPAGRTEGELYNNGAAFKVTARDQRGA